MLDTEALQQLVEQQIKQQVEVQVSSALNEAWLKHVEDNAIKFIQNRIVAKFSNSSALPELIDAIQTSVKDLFVSGQLPGLDSYIDDNDIKQSVNDSVQILVKDSIQQLTIDPQWIEKIETIVNQNASQRVLAKLSGTDLRPIIQEYVDQIIKTINIDVFSSIHCQSPTVELTVLDNHVVVENQFTAKHITAVDTLTVKDFIVKGTINTNNSSWDELAETVGQRAFEKLNDEWKKSLIEEVRQSITERGIDFDEISINGELLVDNGRLSNGVSESSLQSVGTLRSLVVAGETKLNETVSVVKKRLGINTEQPEMALSVWDEEVSLVAGKFKINTAYIGTSRKQGLTVGINKIPAIEINDSGLTAIKQLQVGLHRISHADQVPGHSGTKGDIVFNANPTVENPVFAWQCLGGYRWKVIKAVE